MKKEMDLTADQLLEAAALAERLLQAHKRGLIDPQADGDNLKIMWVLHHMGGQFEHEMEETV